MNRIDLEGRKAVVTGAARGIGYAIAERLLASGAAVAVWDVDGAAARVAAERLGEAGDVAALRGSERYVEQDDGDKREDEFHVVHRGDNGAEHLAASQEMRHIR